MNSEQKVAPLWSLGFRPFFLLAGIYAAFAIALWLALLGGLIHYSGSISPSILHGHEMIYGFGTAVIAGFLLTAIQNWTGIQGVHGRKLQFLALFWLLGRLLMLGNTSPNLLIALVDLGFYPLLGIYVWPYFQKDPDLKIERVFFAFFACFFIGNLLVHLDALGLFVGYARKGLFLGLNTMLIVILFMGGRVIPFFTESSLSVWQPKVRKKIEFLSHASAWLYLVTQLFDQVPAITMLASFFAATIHGLRLLGWYVPRVRRVPLIWILHLSYFWIVFGFLLSAFSFFEFVPTSAATHSFTVGGIGMITLGMMSRVSLGHTGRRLHPSPITVLAYLLLLSSTIVRVLLAFVDASYTSIFLNLSGGLWICSFGLFVFVYLPFLMKPRADN